MNFENVKILIDAIHTRLESKEVTTSEVEKYAAYCMRLKLDSKTSNWMNKKPVEELVQYFITVTNEGLKFDGTHITLQQRGISYDYVAYKNKMLLAYPESMIDIQLVYKGDQFSFSKDSGSVFYHHVLESPFDHKDDDIEGGYMVVKNNRGEFLTVLSKEEITKHRSIAKTDFIWKAWFPEMCMKTLIRKGCKYHFDDIVEGMNEIDNEDYNLDLLGKTSLQKKMAEIRELFDFEESKEDPERKEEIEELRKMCNDKKNAKEFNETFADQVLLKLKGKEDEL